jgi:hypothetical protein
VNKYRGLYIVKITGYKKTYYEISKKPQGNGKVPSGTATSVFDSIEQAKKFIDDYVFGGKK